MKKELPHNTRINTAWFLTSLVFLLKLTSIILFICITVLAYQTQFFPENQEYVNLKINNLKNPTNPDSYISLGLYYYNHGLTKQSLTTFQMAQSLYKYAPRDNSPFSIYQNLIDKQALILEEQSYWEKVTQDKPLYRDAYIQLGITSFKSGFIEEAKSALVGALKVDPLSYEAQKLKDFILQQESLKKLSQEL